MEKQTSLVSELKEIFRKNAEYQYSKDLLDFLERHPLSTELQFREIVLTKIRKLRGQLIEEFDLTEEKEFNELISIDYNPTRENLIADKHQVGLPKKLDMFHQVNAMLEYLDSLDDSNSNLERFKQMIVDHSDTIHETEHWLADPRLIQPSYELFNGVCFEHIPYLEYAKLFDLSHEPTCRLSYIKPGQKIFTYFLIKLDVSQKIAKKQFNIASFRTQKKRVKDGDSKSRTETVMNNKINNIISKYTPTTL
jgi:hypothetical protein